MASEQELIDSVNALSDTQAFFASAGAVTELPGGHGVIKTYTHIKSVSDDQARQSTIRIYVNAKEEAYFLGSNPVPAVDERPEPITAEEVESVARGAGLQVDTVLLEESSNNSARATLFVPADAGKTSSRSFIVWRKEDGALGYKEIA